MPDALLQPNPARFAAWQWAADSTVDTFEPLPYIDGAMDNWTIDTAGALQNPTGPLPAGGAPVGAWFVSGAYYGPDFPGLDSGIGVQYGGLVVGDGLRYSTVA